MCIVVLSVMLHQAVLFWETKLEYEGRNLIFTLVYKTFFAVIWVPPCFLLCFPTISGHVVLSLLRLAYGRRQHFQSLREGKCCIGSHTPRL